MKRKVKLWAGLGLLVLGLAIPVAVVARGEQTAEPATEEASDDEELDEFEPSEQVDADEAISFPVDI